MILEAELKKLEVSLVDLATKLASARHNLAQQLEIEIQQELKDLYMEKAQFQVQFTKVSLLVKEMKVLNFTFPPTLEKTLNHWLK